MFAYNKIEPIKYTTIHIHPTEYITIKLQHNKLYPKLNANLRISEQWRNCFMLKKSPTLNE